MSSNRYAVMGNPISHSLSPTIHQLFAQQTGRALSYEKIQIDLSHFEQQVTDFFSQGGKGLNITLPCKERAFAMSFYQTSRCKQARAANTLWMEKEHLFADNTDGIGLIRDLARYIDIKNKRILLLGAGGAARGVIGPLLDATPAQLTIVNRTAEKAQALQQDFRAIQCCTFEELQNKQYDVVLNATAASLEGQNILLPNIVMAAKPFCYDLAYKQDEPTAFVGWAMSQGCQAVDGLGMLVEQAAEAFYIWHGVMPEVLPVLKILRT